MPVTNYPQGVASFGIPQMGPNPLLINPSGAVLFVNSQTGQNNRGRVTFPGSNAASVTGGSTQGPQGDPTKPLATITYALTFTLAGRGDIIVVMAGHAETLAANIASSAAGVIIYGCGQGDERPTITLAGFSAVLSGAGNSIANCILVMGTTANTAGGLQLTGAGAYAYNVRVTGANVTSVGVLLGAARATFDNGDIDGTTTGFASGVLFGVFDQCQLTNSNVHGIFATAPVTLVANTNVLIKDNLLRQQHATVDPVITGVVTATSGTIQNNRFSSFHAGTAAAYLGGANVSTNVLVIYLQNFGFTGKAGPSSGILVPAVGTIP